jgi:hypothetical protein
VAPVIAPREIAAGAVDRIRLWQRRPKLQRDDVEKGYEPDGQIGIAGLRQELRDYADAIAAEVPPRTASLGRVASLSTY